MRNILDRRLPVLRGIADVLSMRANDVRELLLQRLDHVPSLVERERRLRQIRHLVGIRYHESRDLFDGRDHLRHIRSLSLGSLNLFMVAMSHQHKRITLLRELDRLDVNFGYERTGRVNYLQSALLGPFSNGRRNAVGRVDNPRPFRDLVQFVDEDCALLGQIRYDIAVVHNLLANVNRRAKGIERNLHDIDSPHDTGAEASRLEEKNPLGFRFVAALVYRDALK